MNEYEEGHEKMHEEVKEQFEQQWTLMHAVMDAGGFEAYVRQHGNEVAQAFTGLAPAVACMDERVERATDKDSRPPEYKAAIALEEPTRLALFLREQGVDPTAHDQCGAGAIKAESIGRPGEGDQVAREVLGQAAQMADRKLLESPLDGPHFHVAVVVYVATMPFGPSNAKGTDGNRVLPRGFVISDQLGRTERDVPLAAGIALGDHGFGDLLDKAHRFAIVAVTKTEDERQQLMDRLERVADKLPADQRDRVEVAGFVQPAA